MAERLGVLIHDWWRSDDSVGRDTSTEFWGDGRKIFSPEELLRQIVNIRVLLVAGRISAGRCELQIGRYSSIAVEIGIPPERLKRAIAEDGRKPSGRAS